MSLGVSCFYKQEGKVLTLKDKRKIELLQMTLAHELTIQESTTSCHYWHEWHIARTGSLYLLSAAD